MFGLYDKIVHHERVINKHEGSRRGSVVEHHEHQDPEFDPKIHDKW